MKNYRYFALSIFIGLFLFVNASAQESGRTVKKKTWGNEPIEILTVKVKGTVVDFNQVFTSGNDWFNGLTLSVKNISNKTIVFINLALDFPPPEGASKGTRDRMLYGQAPLPPGETDDILPPKDQPLLASNGTAALTLSDYDDTRSFLDEAGQTQSIREVTIDIDEVIFDDGTMWTGGRMLKRNPVNPDEWIPIENSSPASRKTKPLGYDPIYENRFYVSFST